MATFTSFNNRLPDPTFLVSDAGAVTGTGIAGPGFAGISVRSVEPIQLNRTISGRGIVRGQNAQYWDLDIKYHPMFRESFDVVSNFLSFRRMNPFLVVLPQYNRPKDSAFATYVTTNNITVSGAHLAGSKSLLLQAPSVLSSFPKPGCFINITDTNDVNHTKAYKILAVETNALYQAGKTQPTTSQMRVHVYPDLARNVSSGSSTVWINPTFRVLQKGDTIEYSLNTDNLFEFSLSLEEIQL